MWADVVRGIETGHLFHILLQGVVVGAPKWNRVCFDILVSVIFQKLVKTSPSRHRRTFAYVQECKKLLLVCVSLYLVHFFFSLVLMHAHRNNLSPVMFTHSFVFPYFYYADGVDVPVRIIFCFTDSFVI